MPIARHVFSLSSFMCMALCILKHEELSLGAFSNRFYFRNIPICADSIIKKESMTLAKWVLKIYPPVPRRRGDKSTEDDSSVFHIKFKTESDRTEVEDCVWES